MTKRGQKGLFTNPSRETGIVEEWDKNIGIMEYWENERMVMEQRNIDRGFKMDVPPFIT
jgi:hypothetical protein